MLRVLSPSRPFALGPGRPGLSDLMAIRRQRRALSRLEDAQLRDIGVTAAQARKEARRPPWDVPHHWLR